MTFLATSIIQLYVKSLTGVETVINCLNDISVYDLKKLINEDEPYMLRLIHNSKELDDEQFLNQIDIQNGSVIGCLNKLNRLVLHSSNRLHTLHIGLGDYN